MKFRKNPVVIEAVQFNGYGAGWFAKVESTPWLDEAYQNDILSNVGQSHKDCRLTIKTLEGTLTVSEGDWIIKGVSGELYPCKPDIFALTYEAVE